VLPEYLTTHESLLGDDGGVMTLGLGMLCEHGNCVVLASEQRATYQTLGSKQLSPNDECGKQFHLEPLNCVVSVAGSNSTCHAVYSQFAHMVLNLKDKDNVPTELLMTLLDAARFREMRRVYDWELKKKMGVTLKQWAAGKVPGIKFHRLFVEYGLSILENTPFKVEMIVGGFAGNYGMFFKASQKSKLEEETSPGVYAIGTGQVDAMEQLNKRGQNVHMSLGRTLLHVYEAMLKAQSRTVGPPPKLVAVIMRGEPRMLVYPLHSLETWRKTYESRPDTVSLDTSMVAKQEIMNRLRILEKEEAVSWSPD